jgi:hypothetical protein
MIRELFSVTVNVRGFVGTGIPAISGRKAAYTSDIAGVGVVVGKTTAGRVGMGDGALSGWTGVDVIMVPLIGVGEDSAAFRLGVIRLTQALRYRQMMINAPALRISMDLGGVGMGGW